MSGTIRGRLFGPGLPGAGSDALLSWRGEYLAVTTAATQREVAASELRVDASGFNAAQTRLAWTSAEGEFVLFLDTPAREALAASAPAGLAAGLLGAARAQRQVERRFRLGWSVLGLILLLPLLALVLFVLNADSIAGSVAERIPPEHEAKLGELTLAQVRAGLKLHEDGPALRAVRDIGQRLSEGSRYRYRFFVADSPEVNAFAAPGGVVVVYTGLIRAADSAEELAGVLAHEVAHVELRHSLKAAVKGLGLRALAALALGDLSGGVAGDVAARLTDLKFSRDAETEADREGLRRLLAAGISPHGMPRFFETLAAGEGNTAVALAVLSSHPPSRERMARLRDEIGKLPPAQFTPLPIDWREVREAAR